ncbi:hypothetical protein AB9P05_02510 [Roseivirga sp. BDSF3-8]|uniref:hypothetical protein n=1 Tax=Roseivirga sp. BDSF3-8 TaxID=3241598 RepID=UPI0035326ABB
MKTFYPHLLFILLLLPGCYMNSGLYTDAAVLDTSIPSRPYAGQVDVYFPGERLPDKAYRKVAFLESDRSDPSDRIQDMRKMARKYGADAIIFLSLTPSLQVQAVNDSELNGEQVDVRSVGHPFLQHAIAVVFEENLSPSAFNQYAEVYLQGDGEMKEETLLLKTTYDYYQNVADKKILAEGKLVEKAYLYPERTSIGYLLSFADSPAENNRNSAGRQTGRGHDWQRKFRVVRSQEGFINKIFLKEKDLYPGQGYESFILHLHYDNEGRIVQMKVYQDGGARNHLKEVHTYSYRNNRLSEEKIARMENDELKAWLRVEYTPFPEDYTIDQARNP